MAMVSVSQTSCRRRRFHLDWLLGDLAVGDPEGAEFHLVPVAGGDQDPRHAGKHPELRDKVLTPDVLIEAHSASLEMAFYTGQQFPPEYRTDAFAAEHGSWNRAKRTGYKVIRIPLRDGKATGEYEDFMTGFVTKEGKVWGRPVGVAVGADGSLFVSDDGGEVIWKVSYRGH